MESALSLEDRHPSSGSSRLHRPSAAGYWQGGRRFGQMMAAAIAALAGSLTRADTRVFLLYALLLFYLHK